MQKTIKVILVLTTFFATFFASYLPVAKAEYSKEYVIDDGVFSNKGVMTADEINSFLASQGSWLANYSIPEYVSVPYPLASGGLAYVDSRQYNDVTEEPLYNKTVAQLIYDESQVHSVNPRVILSTLQKESSAITRSAPSSQTTASWPLFYMYNESMEACLKYGTSCNDDAFRTLSIQYGGVGQQIAYATAWFSVRFSQYAASKSFGVTVDGITFTCQNAATRILYIYTPHVSSWLNFYNIWTQWFEDPTYGPPPSDQPYVMEPLLSLSAGSWNTKNATRVVSGNFDNDSIEDVAAMYDYGNCGMAIFIFESSNNFMPVSKFYSGSYSWCVGNTSNITAGNFDNDGKDDIAVIYNYGNASIGMWLMKSSQNFTPTMARYIAPGNWNYGATSSVASGDVDYDGLDDVSILYNYGNAQVAMWSFESSNSFGLRQTFLSDPGSFDLARSKSLVPGDFDGDGKADFATMYDYGSAMMGIIYFRSSANFSPIVKYHTGINSWNVSVSSNLIVGNFDQLDNLDDIAVMYDYGEQAIGIFCLNSSANFVPSSQYWSGRRNFSMVANNATIVSGDYNNDDMGDIATFYDYGGGAMALFAFKDTGL